jgi:hypothetical protein
MLEECIVGTIWDCLIGAADVLVGCTDMVLLLHAAR